MVRCVFPTLLFVFLLFFSLVLYYPNQNIDIYILDSQYLTYIYIFNLFSLDYSFFFFLLFFGNFFLEKHTGMGGGGRNGRGGGAMGAIGAIAAAGGGGGSGGSGGSSGGSMLVDGDVVRVSRGELKDLLGVVR